MSEQQTDRQDRNIRLASIVACDVVGYSTMSEKNQDRAARQIEALRVRIEQVAAAHQGRLFNTAGDGFMLEFTSAGSALSAIQDILDKRNKGEPQLRVGAHVGDVVVTVTNDLLGHGVNIAARLQALAAPGSALVSAEFRSMARTSPSAAFQSRGRQPLENIEQKVQTFEILSQRQRTSRFLKRMGWGAATVAVVAAAAFVAPTVYTFARDKLGTFQPPQIEAPAPAPEAAAAPDVQQATANLPPERPALLFQAGQTFRDCETCPEMIVLRGGLFTMGSAVNETGRGADEGPQREVSVAPFAIGKTEVTFTQWDACVVGGGCDFSPPDRGWGRADRPVIGISWQDAQAYLTWLNRDIVGPPYRLLTEAEWEYAARAGAQSAYAFGPTLVATQATFRARRTTRAGAHAANSFALFDLHGNAAEWVADCYSPSYDLAPLDGAAIEAEQCVNRVYRGGLYSDAAAQVRAAARAKAAPDARPPGLGFRVARSLS